jgi:hypothetical protein
MIFNYYEEAHKKSSLTNFIEKYNLYHILCNDIIKAGEPEKINYKPLEDISLEDINYILEYDIGKPEIKTLEELETLEEHIKEDIEYYYNYSNEEYYQYYIISPHDLRYWNLINYDIFYIEELDLYYVGIGHWGTSWSYILTNIPLITNEKGNLEIDRDYIFNNLDYDL